MVAVAGSETFWLATFQEHGSSILAFLTSRLGRRDLAEDMLQETFLRAMRRLGKVPGEGNIKSYLFTTAHHLILDHARKKRPALFSEVTEDEAGWIDRATESETQSPESSLDLQRVTELLESELQGLTPDQRLAFELGVIQQKSYADVAREQGWTVNKVKIDVFRARKKIVARLRDHLRPDLETSS